MIYNKEVQTTAVETEVPEVSVDDIRQQIQRERDLEAERTARDEELEEESIQLDKEIEQEIRGRRSLHFLVHVCFNSFHRTVGGRTNEHCHSTRIP